MGKFILKDKSFAFAINVVKLCRSLQDSREYIISKQLLRSGTAIGAMVREAEFAESRADFAHKLSIALKEGNETQYWLSLLSQSFPDFKDRSDVLHAECNEIVAILVTIVKKTRLTKSHS